MGNAVTPTTPGREARTIVIAAAILAGVGCYYASARRVPILSTILEGMASVLAWISPLVHIRIPSEVLSSCAGGILVFILGAFCVPPLEKMCGPRIGDMESAMRARQREKGTVKIQ
jgi:hypothetical protein